MPTTRSALNLISNLPSRQVRGLLWVGFGGLLLLMGIFGLSAISFLYQIEVRQDRLRQGFVERDQSLERLRASIYLSGTYIRDFLVDRDEVLAAKHRSQFLKKRREIEANVDEYRRLLTANQRKPFEQLSQELTIYFDTLMPALNWTPEQRATNGLDLIQEEMLPRRMNAVSLADQIQQVSQRQLEASSQQLGDLFTGYRRNLIALLLSIMAIGVTLASVTMWRLFRLEHESRLRFEDATRAREEMQRLSAELVSAQENERRRLSRELHDEVGQMLSALMLSLGNVGSSIKVGNSAEAVRQLQQAQDMTEQNARVVRNLSLLLRPTMLDDLGLMAALKWLARETSRTSSIQVDVAAEDLADDFPEEHRTCIYRVVQEAVRNASRHAAARHVRVYLKRDGLKLNVLIQDDGKGFDTEHETGLGILGMKERVTRLGGSLKVESALGRGTIVSFELPLPDRVEAAGLQEISPLRTA